MISNPPPLNREILYQPIMETKKLIRKYYDAYVSRDLSAVEEILDPNFEAVSKMMKFRSAKEFLDGSWGNTENLVGLDYEIEVVDEKGGFYVLKWDFGKSTMHTAEYVEVRDGKITKILWINMEPDFFTKLVEK